MNNNKHNIILFNFRKKSDFSKITALYLAILATIVLFNACSYKQTLFELLPSSKTNIYFVNTVIEDDNYNVLEYMNIYTGAGVAAGDINNDGLTDLYFSGNQTTGRLYLNKGGFQFEDITEKAGLITKRWCTGVSMVDINQDGFLDIYVSVSGSKKFGDLSNLLYINNKNGTFTEKAAEYGLAEKRLTMNASFFDYDKDGDLDVFMITNPADEMVSGVNVIKERAVKGESEGTDILYRNNGNETFTDVSKEAGILLDGYSLGCAISDVNNDGFPDIYVSNDFLSNDILYINNGNGTFTDKIGDYLKHCSFASMGCDIADFNNDGLPDIYTLDMLPEDNFRRKMIIPSASYDKFQLSLEKGYTPQYTRNCLQLNNGISSFSDISFLSGVSSTDWSWAALFADYDNDGDKDLMVTNGFYRDLGDLDYINYQTRLQSPMGQQDAKRAEKLKAIKGLKNIPLQNYLFENNGDLTFTKRSDDWGFIQKGFSNGACYADLDNDGDLELILNEFNSIAKVYENKTNELKENNFLNIKLKGNRPNIQGIGAKIWVYTEGGLQFQELYPSRGYESSVDFKLHFGLGLSNKIDSVVVQWPNGNKQVETTVSINKTLEVSYVENNKLKILSSKIITLFTNISEKVNYWHQENSFSDFKLQPLLPHLHSQNGPFITVGDVNGDGLEDFFIGAALGSTGSFFIQNKKGLFMPKRLSEPSLSDDMGVSLFDFDGDKDLDLYIVGGGSEFAEGSKEYQDRLFQNDGKGNFIRLDNVLPDTRGSGSCVLPCDFDHDGDLDLFIGGRVAPWRYPMSPHSYLLKNQGSKFIDDTPPYLQNIGMVTAANWADIDGDTWEELVLVGEFMPFTIFKNDKGTIRNLKSEIPNSNGWWNSSAHADFDGDGDMDFIVGNLGLNSRYKASAKEPLCIYAKDYDKNGRIDPIMCHYVAGDNVIAHTRDEMIKQINPMRGRFKSYNDFATANLRQSFTEQEVNDAFVVRSTCFESSYFENKGNGQFERHPLSIEAQFAPVTGILIQDMDKDGFLDVLLAGNDYATEASTGRYDAMTGVLLKGDGKGHFHSLRSRQTGFLANKDVKCLAKLTLFDGSQMILVANNSAKMEAFYFKNDTKKVVK